MNLDTLIREVNPAPLDTLPGSESLERARHLGADSHKAPRGGVAQYWSVVSHWGRSLWLLPLRSLSPRYCPVRRHVQVPRLPRRSTTLRRSRPHSRQ